jgi:hypothetical protein
LRRPGREWEQADVSLTTIVLTFSSCYFQKTVYNGFSCDLISYV